MNGANKLGPMVSRVQFEKIQDLIQSGIDEGAKVLVGGTGRPEHFNRGYSIRPTVFADVTPGGGADAGRQCPSQLLGPGFGGSV